MARELKVWGIILFKRSDDNISGTNQIRAIVAAKTKKDAAELFGISVGEFTQYGGTTGNEKEIAVALSKPYQVFGSPLNHRNHDEYREISRPPYIARPRQVRRAYVAPPATLNNEELAYIADMFESANNPIAVKIAAKARALLAYKVG